MADFNISGFMCNYFHTSEVCYIYIYIYIYIYMEKMEISDSMKMYIDKKHKVFIEGIYL